MNSVSSSGWRHRLESLQPADSMDPGGRLLVLSAHPDDEVLAIGGWLAGQTERDVTFVTATDGEGSHPSSASITRDELRMRRPQELHEALERLGFISPSIHRLGLPDGGLDTETAALKSALGDLVNNADLVLAPFERDGHRDHDTLGAVAIDLCGKRRRLWRFPIWTWAWTQPGQQDWLENIQRLTCTAQGRFRKRQAIAAFETQIKPIGDDPDDVPVVEPALLQHAFFAPEAVII